MAKKYIPKDIEAFKERRREYQREWCRNASDEYKARQKANRARRIHNSVLVWCQNKYNQWIATRDLWQQEIALRAHKYPPVPVQVELAHNWWATRWVNEQFPKSDTAPVSR